MCTLSGIQVCLTPYATSATSVLIRQISAGELGTSVEKLEAQNILLLNEADVFLEKCSPWDVNRDTLVSVFLQKLGYFHGMLFLTLIRVTEIDDAMASQIHSKLRQ